MAKKLTKKQQLFVDEYLIDLNATQAAIRAGYSVESARDIGCENLTKPNIQQAIAEKMAERSKRTGVNQDRVVLELAKIAFVNISDVVDTDTGEILPNASQDDLACIESVKFKQSDNQYGGSIEREVKVASKLKALEMLGKHLGMWNDKVDVNVAIPVVISGEGDLED
jgi:phage terminase small subunit|nr:MAG TPA: Terminase small subunit [Caudoviricetes sp.]